MIEEPESGYRPDVDGLRALAILAVVAFHCFPKEVRGGFTGVDIFFVISGFLITRLILSDIAAGRFTIARFYARRIRRIFPALAVVLGVCTVAAWAVLLPENWRQFGRDSFASAAFFGNIALAFERRNYFVSVQRPLIHLWSLGVEEQFYLVWPVLLFALRNQRRRVTTLVLSLIAAISFALNVIFVWKHQDMTFYLPVSRAWELALGSLLAVHEVRLTKRRAEIAAWSGLALCLASAALANELYFPGVWALPPTIGAVLLIAGGPESWVSRNLFSTRPAIALGLISYPLYLWQWPLLTFVRIRRDGIYSPLRYGLVCTAGALVLAALTYRFVERPIRAAPVTPARLRLLCGVMIAIAIAAAAAALRLLPPRLHGADVERVIAASKDVYSFSARFGRFEDMHQSDVPGALPGTIVFAGDSHMEQFWPRLELLANRGATPTLRFVTEPGCPPLRYVARGRCDAFADFAYTHARKRDVTAVVFSASWVGCLRPGVERSMLDFSQRIAGLTRRGKKVYVILSTPRSWRFDPANMLSLRDGHLEPAAPVAVRDLAREPFEADRLVRAAALQGGATVIEPVPWLCPGGVCPAFSVPNGPAYSDAHHLRPWYVRERALFLDEIVLRGGS